MSELSGVTPLPTSRTTQIIHLASSVAFVEQILQSSPKPCNISMNSLDKESAFLEISPICLGSYV